MDSVTIRGSGRFGPRWDFRDDAPKAAPERNQQPRPGFQALLEKL